MCRHMEELYPKKVCKRTQKNIIDKDMLKYLITIGTSNTDIAKIFNVHRNMVALRIKKNESENTLEEPADDRVIVNPLKKV